VAEPTVEVFLERLKELKAQHVEHLSAGSVASHEEYRHICGVIKGLSMAELEIKELLSRISD
jgi:hypothetical protein